MRINRTNPEQPAAQPVQSHAPLKAQTEVNGFELPEQEIPKETQKEPPKAAKPPTPKKEKPAKKPRRRPEEEVEDDEERARRAGAGRRGRRGGRPVLRRAGRPENAGPDPDHHRARGFVRRRHCDPAQGRRCHRV